MNILSEKEDMKEGVLWIWVCRKNKHYFREEDGRIKRSENYPYSYVCPECGDVLDLDIKLQ